MNNLKTEQAVMPMGIAMTDAIAEGYGANAKTPAQIAAFPKAVMSEFRANIFYDVAEQIGVVNIGTEEMPVYENRYELKTKYATVAAGLVDGLIEYENYVNAGNAFHVLDIYPTNPAIQKILRSCGMQLCAAHQLYIPEDEGRVVDFWQLQIFAGVDTGHFSFRVPYLGGGGSGQGGTNFAYDWGHNIPHLTATVVEGDVWRVSAQIGLLEGMSVSMAPIPNKTGHFIKVANTQEELNAAPIVNGYFPTGQYMALRGGSSIFSDLACTIRLANKWIFECATGLVWTTNENGTLVSETERSIILLLKEKYKVPDEEIQQLLKK
jgi:hypothetical protein